MDFGTQEPPPFADIISFLAIFADSVNWSNSDISLPVFGVMLDDESYAIPQREPEVGSSFEITAVESIAITERAYWRILENITCPLLPDVVALKIPYRDGERDVDIQMEKCLTSLVKEVRILRNPYLRSHENIVSLLGVCWRSWAIDDSINNVAPVLILELADQGNLAHFLSEGTAINSLQQISLALDVCAGVQALHDVGVAHCDIKPKNILVFRREDSWVAKISDFGDVVWESSTDSDGVEVPEGTKAWQPPGRQRKQTLQDLIRGDVYSLTLVIWSVLTMGRSGGFIADSNLNELEASKLNGSLVAMAHRDVTEWLRLLGIDTANFDREENRLSKGLQVDSWPRVVTATDFIRVFRLVVEMLDYKGSVAIFQSHFDPQITLETELDMTSKVEKPNRPTTMNLNANDNRDVDAVADTMSCLQIQSIPTSAEDPERPLTPHSDLLRDINRLLSLEPPVDDHLTSARFIQNFTPVAYSMCIELIPKVVRDRILVELKTKTKNHQTDDKYRRVASLQYAMLQLKFVTLDENAANALEEALQLLGQSAVEGSAFARQILGPIFNAFNRPIPFDDQTWSWILMQETWRRSLTAQKQLRRQSEFMYESARIMYRLHLTTTGECTLARDSIWDNITREGDNFLSQYPKVSCSNLGEAANVGKSSLITGMLSAGQDINQRFENGETALLRACRHGHTEVVKLLLDAGADPRIASTSNKTPLHFLPAFDDEHIPNVARSLLSHNASLEVVSSGAGLDLFCDTAMNGTPLQWAVNADSKPACEALIAAGADAWFYATSWRSPVTCAAEQHQYYLLSKLLSARHVRPHLMRPILANVKTWCAETEDGRLSLNYHEQYPIVNALCNVSQQAFGGTFGRLTIHGNNYQKACTDTLGLLLSHGEEQKIPNSSLLDVALQFAPPSVVKWILDWYRSHSNSFPENINNGVGTLVHRGDRGLFDLLLQESVIPPQSSSARQAAIVRMAGFSDDPYYLNQYIRAEKAGNNQANLDLTIPFEQAVINGKYSVATYLFEEGNVDLIPYKVNNQYHDSANILGRFLERSKRFMNLEKRVRFVAGMTDQAFVAADKPFGGEVLNFRGVAMSPLHAAVIHGEFRAHFKPDARIVNAIFESLPNFCMDMPLYTPTWCRWRPFHLAADVGNVAALNEFLGRGDINFEELTGEGENAYDIAVSRFGSPSKSPEWWGVPDDLKSRHINERDLTTMRILDLLHDDFGLQPKKKVLTIYRPNEDLIAIIPPRGGEVKLWTVNMEDVLAIPEDTRDMILSKTRALPTGNSFFVTTPLDVAHILAEHVASTIQEHVPQLTEILQQRRADNPDIWPSRGLDENFELAFLFPARGSALERNPHSIYQPRSPQSTLPSWLLE